MLTDRGRQVLSLLRAGSEQRGHRPTSARGAEGTVRNHVSAIAGQSWISPIAYRPGCWRLRPAGWSMANEASVHAHPLVPVAAPLSPALL
jgi:hypothetical protein